MNTATLPDRNKEYAKQAVDRFVRRFEKSYRLLAYHAALPLVLTPELLNYLRNQFLRGQVPWVAEVDLLLSDLCSQVGYELYAMDTAVRAYLLEEMKQELGEQRMQEVARLLISYVRHQAQTNPFIGQQELQAQQWAAMVYLDDQREKAVREISEAFQGCMTSGGDGFSPSLVNKAEMARLSRITQELSPQLSAYSNLLDYAAVVSRLLTDSADLDAESINRPYPVLSDLELRLPRELIPGYSLQGFEFDVVTVNAQGREVKREKGQAQYFTEDLGNGVTLEMVSVPGGTFLMGSPEGEKDSYDRERPQHQVKVEPFFMGKYPVTQAQWRAIADLPKVKRDLDPDPSRFKGDNRPVERVNWDDAVEFCTRLSRETGREYRLPSEAEWEYACRAGTTTPFHFGETITGKLANYRASETYAEEPKGEYREETTPVGQFPPNAFGLYDMHGQVWEWCVDTWHKNYDGAPTDGSAWTTGRNDNRSPLRGGSWFVNPQNCRSASRSLTFREQRDLIYGVIGFRVAFCGIGIVVAPTPNQPTEGSEGSHFISESAHGAIGS